MITTFYPICGVRLGFQLTEGETPEGKLVSIALLDVFIITIQFAWYKE